MGHVSSWTKSGWKQRRVGLDRRLRRIILNEKLRWTLSYQGSRWTNPGQRLRRAKNQDGPKGIEGREGSTRAEDRDGLAMTKGQYRSLGLKIKMDRKSRRIELDWWSIQGCLARRSRHANPERKFRRVGWD